MSTLTAIMGLGKAVDGDNARTYLATTLAAALDILDDHNHSNGDGAPVKRIASGVHASRPAAGNAGHVYLSTNTGQLSLDSGAAWLEAAILSTLPVFSAGLRVSAGNISIGGAPSSSVGLFLDGAVTSGVNQWGAHLAPDFSSAATSQGTGLAISGETAAAAFTLGTYVALEISNLTKGAGSSVTSAYGGLIKAQTAGGTDNFGLYIEAPSGGSGVNEGLRNLGRSYLALPVGIGVVPAGATPYLAIDPGAGNVAASGSLRLVNSSGGAIAWRNTGDSADITVTFSTNNRLAIAGSEAVSATASAGGGQAVPATVLGYWNVDINGSSYKIPLFS